MGSVMQETDFLPNVQSSLYDKNSQHCQADFSPLSNSSAKHRVHETIRIPTDCFMPQISLDVRHV